MGCKSAPVNGPTRSTDLERDMKWHKAYSKARASEKTDAEQACLIYRELSIDNDFPLYQLASLRAIDVCPDVGQVSMQKSAWPLWLDELRLDVALRKAERESQLPELLSLTVEKSKQKLPQKEKVEWIQKAIQLAKQTNAFDQIPILEKRLYGVAPRLNPKPKIKDALAIAGDFRKARDFDSAQKYYQRVLKAKSTTFAQKISALKGIRLAYKNSRQIDMHLRACQDLVLFLRKYVAKSPKNKTLKHGMFDAEIYRARALWTQGEAGAARQIFSRLEKKMKGWESRAELYWLMGRMAEERRELDQVSSYLNKALAEPIRDQNLREKILWYLAWNERSRKGLEQAHLLFNELAERTESDFVRARARFWQGRTLKDGGRKDEANVIFEKLQSEDPIGYYGLLAHRELGTAIRMKSADSNTEPEVELPFDTKIADWLALLDEHESLNRFLDIASQDYKRSKKTDTTGWFNLFKYYAKGGLYQNLYGVLYELKSEEREQILASHPDLLFPLPWNSEVKSAALTYGVQEELIYSIMRQESAFEKRARSAADAFGLMQILPEVASELSKRYSIPYESMDDLFEPEVNIQAGAAHLKELLERHKGQFILAVAAYNASDRAIRNWMSVRFRGDPLEFIEEIPYEETRTYIRLVMRNLVFYNLLQSKSASIDFPQWLLKLDRG